MGDDLASAIGAAVGSEIVLLTPAADGSTGNDLYTVAGLFHTGLDAMDRGLVLMPLASLQGLLRLPPERIHEVGIKLRDITTATATATTLAAQLGKILPVRVLPWQELTPELADYVQFNHRVTTILSFIFFLMAAMGIVNTMLMAIIERTREIGMLMAVGMRPVQVVGLIAAEAVSLAGASLVLGALLGLPLLWYLQVHGLNLGGKRGVVSLAGIVVGPLWYGRQDFTAYAQTALGLAVTALAASLYPALRAAGFRPAEALRKV
jgi:ABC-type lipoprotein release transport system permease subunit